MVELYPEVEPYETGMLDVGDGNLVYWEACGNPDGKPALVVHGGPGTGVSDRMRRAFDPVRYRIVLFDQRGSGRSTPHAADPGTDLSVNTTDHLIADMELLRERLGIGKWLLHGGSWGSTLILAYAQRYPERVSEIVIAAVTTTSHDELDWLYRGVGRFFPEAWERFRDGAPADARDGDVFSLLAGYSRLLDDPDPAVRAKATHDWAAWEDAVVALEPGGKPNAYSDRPSPALAAFVRICAHYFSHAGWLEDGVLLREAGRLAGIPGVLVHGRLDLSGPAGTAWRLARAWPGSELTVLDGSGHQGTDERHRVVLGALDRFATT